MSFTTDAIVKRRLRIPAGVTTHDALIADIVSEINEEIISVTGQAGLAGATYSPTLSVWDNGMTSIGLDNFPINSVVALTIDGSLISASRYVIDDEIGYVHMKDGAVLPIGEGIIEITYDTPDTSAGSKTLQRAATNWSVSEFNKAPSHGFKGESMARYKYTLDPEDMPASVSAAIGRYRKMFEL